MTGALLLAQGCFPSDPGWSLQVSNESDRAVLVAIDDGPRTIVYAPAKADGHAYVTLGVGNRGVTVLDERCGRLHRVSTGDQGSFLLTITPDGSARVTQAGERDPKGSLRTLSGICSGEESCAGGATPWPTALPTRPPMEWCEGR